MNPNPALIGLACAFSFGPCPAATNDWTKPGSGSWEEPYWSLGSLPRLDQEVVAIRNPGWKAVAISANTAALFPGSLRLNNLELEAPADSFNQLLLNWAGFQVPLSVESNLVIGVNGSLVSRSSKIEGGNFWLSGSALFADGSQSVFNTVGAGNQAPGTLRQENATLLCASLFLGNGFPADCTQAGGAMELGLLELRANSTFRLEGGSLIASNIAVYPFSEVNITGGSVLTTNLTIATNDTHVTISGGEVRADFISLGDLTFTGGRLQSRRIQFEGGELIQSGGTHVVSQMALAGGYFTSFYWEKFSTYTLSNGVLVSGDIVVGSGGKYSPKHYGEFSQTGGAHTNTAIHLTGAAYNQGYAASFGFYDLSGGLLVSDWVEANAGGFSQSGGTNFARQLSVINGGDYFLSGGELLTGNTFVTDRSGVNGYFFQTGGMHTISNRLLLDAGQSGWGTLIEYALSGGMLEAASIEVGAGASLRVTGGTVTNSELFCLSGTAGFRALLVTNSLFGKLQITNAATSAARLILSEPGATSGPVVLRFQDSRDVSWSGKLEIYGWQASVHHIFVGSTSQALTPEQLDQITFFVDGASAAVLLPNGELMPGATQYLPVGNAWLKTTNGERDEPFWSAGQLPNLSQGVIAITNQGWKAIVVSSATANAHPESLALETLVITAPADSGSTLLLNYVGLDVPLSIAADLIVGPRCTLDSYYSDVRVRRLYGRGSVRFQDGSTATILNVFLPGEISHLNGRVVIDSLHIPSDSAGTGLYSLSEGRLYSNQLDIGADSFQSYDAAFRQFGGAHTNAGTLVKGAGYYLLVDGSFASDSMELRSGRFEQIAGTSFIKDLKIALTGQVVTGGTLTTSNLLIVGTLIQTGGVHVASRIELSYGAHMAMLSGVLSNSGPFVLTDGELWAGTVTNYLGTLQCNSGPTWLWINGYDTWRNPGPTTLFFADSHQQTWTGRLLVADWSQSSNTKGYGPDRIFFGDTAAGLTADQLSKIIFIDPMGLPPGEYPARLLSTGEVVPDAVWQTEGFVYTNMPDGTVTITKYEGAGGAISVPSAIGGRPVTAIGDNAFLLNAQVTSVLIPEGVLTIGNYAFSQCANLSHVELPASLMSIGVGAFGLSGLTSITLGPNVNYIGGGAFDRCGRLGSITVSAANGVFATVDGVLFSKDLSVLIVCPAGKAGPYSIPVTVRQVEDSAFANCSLLSAVSIPVAVRDIGILAFQNCTGLTAVTLPASVTNAGPYAWCGCASVQAYTVDPLNPVYSSRDGILYDKARTRLLEYPGSREGNCVVASDVLVIEAHAFQDAALSSIVIPDTVREVGLFAFWRCTALTNAVVGKGLTILAYGVFDLCSNLRRVTLGQNLLSIGDFAFFNCERLDQVVVPPQVSYIGNEAFGWCWTLQSLFFRGDMPAFTRDPFEGSTNVTSYYLPGTKGWSYNFASRPARPWVLSYPVILGFGSKFGVRSNQFGFVISWATNGSVIVEASSEVSAGAWSPQATVTLSNGSSYFADPQWPVFSRRFYRVRSGP